MHLAQVTCARADGTQNTLQPQVSNFIHSCQAAHTWVAQMMAR